MTEDELVSLLIYLLNKNYFLVSKCFQLTFIHLLSGHLALNSPFGWYLSSMGAVCFKLAVTALFVLIRYFCVMLNLSILFQSSAMQLDVKVI